MDQARSHLSPKGGQSPAVFAGDWPPAGALACGDADAEGEAGYAIACGGIDMGVDEGIDMGVAVPFEALESGRVRSSSRWVGLGCGACQRSSKRRRRLPTEGNSSTPGDTDRRELSGRIVSGW